MYAFQEKIAVITGGAQSLGLETTKALTKRGIKVVVGDILGKEEQEAISQINNQAGKEIALFQTCDVADPTALHSLIDLAIKHFGQLDILINNAGISDVPIEADPQGEVARRCADVNLRANLDGTIHAVTYWNQQADRKGVVVNVTSMVGYAPTLAMAAYCATKAGVIAYTKLLASLAPKIRVNAIAPNWINTKLIHYKIVQRHRWMSDIIGIMDVQVVVDEIIRLIEDESTADDVVQMNYGLPNKICELTKSTDIEKVFDNMKAAASQKD